MTDVKQSDKKPRRVGDGTPGPGRPKGVPNKTTTAVKVAIQAVFDGMGDPEGKSGVETMLDWARENRTDFYTKVYPKILPLDLNHSGEVVLRDWLTKAE